MAGPDPRDPGTLHQPAPQPIAFDRGDLQGLRLGIDMEWLQHAEHAIMASVQAMLKTLVARGATIVEFELPDLRAVPDRPRADHSRRDGRQHGPALFARHRKDFGLGTRMNLALAREPTARDYVRAQQVRPRMTSHFEHVLADVDAIVTPTHAFGPRRQSGRTSCPAARAISALTSALMRFVFR